MSYEEELSKLCISPHPEVRRGVLSVGHDTIFDYDVLIDLTGDVTVGNFCMLGRGTQILTHDHYHFGTIPLRILQDMLGVKWAHKKIGNDVWIHGAIILMQVTEIPDGVVVGAGSVLTKIPGPYEIWAGNPAVKVGER